MENKRSLNNRIAHHREQRKTTQQELADAVDVRRETIVNLEKGKYNPSLKLALCIAQFFEVQVEEIFWLTNTEL